MSDVGKTGLLNASANKKAEKILNMTIKLFLGSGARKVTMDDIAENANVSKVTLYKYFKDKDSLYLFIGSRIFSRYASLLHNVLVSGKAYPEKLYDYMDVICEFTDSGEFSLCRELSRYNQEVDAEQNRYHQAYRQTLLSLIDEGIRNGMLKSDLDRDAVFYYIDMGMSYYQQNDEYRSRILRDEAFRSRFLTFYISGIFSTASELISKK
jgi:AcrR family transcriptional regulator